MTARPNLRFAFTEYIRSVRPGEPFPAGFDAAWEKLHDALQGELKKRSLWNAPPSYLGIYGWKRWSEPDAIGELMADCFANVFIRRLSALKALCETMDNVEGLVFRNIRNFIHDVQKKYNPLDYRVFKVLQAATRRAIEAQSLYVLDGGPGLGNATVLGFVPWGTPEAARSVDLEEHVRAWCDDLLPELVTATPSGLREVEERLRVHLGRLERRAIAAFRFKDVVDPLKNEVRLRWTALWCGGEGETGIEGVDEDLVQVVKLVRPDSGFEERQVFETLLDCVDEALGKAGKTRKTREHVRKLWRFLLSHLAESGEDRMPSGYKIAELLGIPRQRLPEFRRTLQEQVEMCRQGGRA